MIIVIETSFFHECYLKSNLIIIKIVLMMQ